MSFVDAHDFSVDLVLRVLGIPASTYYDWRARRTAPSLRRREDEELLRLIDAIRGEHEFAATYGSPRVWLELRRRGVRVGRKRVERIMRVHGRQSRWWAWARRTAARSRRVRRFRIADPPQPVESLLGLAATCLDSRIYVVSTAAAFGLSGGLNRTHRTPLPSRREHSLARP